MFREKKHAEVPYVTHPLMVCQLLQRFGLADELTLAIALLHDVLEDCEPYRSKHELLRDELQKALASSGYDARAAKNIARYIYDHCEELCNDMGMEEDKRTYQVMHAHAMSDRGKLIKILDQTASVMDDIFFESVRSRDKVERFAMKGLSVVKAASRGGTPAIMSAADLFDDCYAYLRELHRLPREEEQERRKGFDPGAMIRRSTTAYDTPDKVRIHPSLEQGRKAKEKGPVSGCIGVSLKKDGRGDPGIAGYDCLIDHVFEEFSVANRASWYLLGELESFEHNTHVDVGDVGIVGKQLVRHYRVSPPIAYEHFNTAVKEAERQVRNSAQENSIDIQELPGKPVLDHRMELQIKKAISEQRRENFR